MQRKRRRIQSMESLEARHMLDGHALVISEFMADNESGLQDSDGEFSDWIELYNNSDQPIDLTGWALTDDAANPQKWLLPDVQLAARAYTVVFASGKDRQDEQWHTNFRLSAEGEYLALVDPQGQVAQDFGQQYPAQRPDVAYGFPYSQTSLLSASPDGRYLVPRSADANANWTDTGFDDASWTSFVGPIGYDLRPGLINPGFESRTLNEWDVTGQAAVVSASLGIEPTERDHLLQLNLGLAATRLQVENFLDLPRFALNNVTGNTVAGATTVKRTFEFQAGDSFSFDWNFLTNPAVESADFVLVTLQRPDQLRTFLVADVSDAIFDSASFWPKQTDYSTFQYQIEEAGEYTLGITLAKTERSSDSTLLLDDFRINGFGATDLLLNKQVTTDLMTEVIGTGSSVWLRYPFTVDNVDVFHELAMSARYNDGFVAFLNGTQLAADNAPPNVEWNSVANSERNDVDSLESRLLSGASALPALRSGDNLLSVQMLTTGLRDLNGLLDVQLLGVGEISSNVAYLKTGTPGLANISEAFEFTQPVQFSVPHGFYETSFLLELTSATPGATIYYTTDGSAPTTDSLVYSGALRIDQSTVVRAISAQDGLRPATATTQSYLFVEDVVHQSEASVVARGFPDSWGGNFPAVNYQMDPTIIGQNGDDAFNGVYAATVREDLLSLPSAHFAGDGHRRDLFGEEEGIYSHPLRRGDEWERPTSFEIIYPDGQAGLAVNAGLRLNGGVLRYEADKMSFRLIFRDEYGPPRLDYPLFGPTAASTFDSLTLRSSSGEHLVGIHYIRDQFHRESQLATGNAASHGTFMHLYINGVYWGMYNPVERIDGQFAANYFGGSPDEYDVLNAGDQGEPRVSVVNGSADAWNEMIRLAQRVNQAETQQLKTEAYLQLQGLNPDGTRNPEWESYLDTQNYIDYVISNVYGRNSDWPVRNYFMLRRRGSDSTGFKFFAWDGEFTLDRGSRRTISSVEEDGPGIIYNLLKKSDAFLLEFSDRIQQHFSPGGAFYVDPANQAWDPEHPERNIPAARYVAIAESVRRALVPESARWGNDRMNLDPPFTRNEKWQPIVDRNLSLFFPSRSEDFIEDAQREFLIEEWPGASHYRPAPVFNTPAGQIDAGSQVDLLGLLDDQQVFYTLDGTDPVLPNLQQSPSAIIWNGPLGISQRTQVNARIFQAGRWSALATVLYTTDATLPNESNLRIAELNYNPHDAMVSLGEADVDNDEFEFIELVNLGRTALDLEGVRLIRELGQGVEFTFGSQILSAGQRLVIPKNIAAFQSRYGANISLAIGNSDNSDQWVFQGNLSNSGEILTLVDALGTVLQRLAYGDGGAWPGRADGEASSLEVIDFAADLSSPMNYRSSSEFGGSPGSPGRGPDNRIVINEVLTNTDNPLVDQVELWNRSVFAIDASGWYLSDSDNNFLRYQLPAGTIIPAGQFLVLSEIELGFALSSEGDDLYLLSADATGRPARFVDRVAIDAAEAGVALGRWPNGSGGLFPMLENSLGATNPGPRSAKIVITEIRQRTTAPADQPMLDAESIQFVELFNPTERIVSLANWKVTGDIDFQFDATAALDPQQTLLLLNFDPKLNTERRLAFQRFYGLDDSAMLLGPFIGSLGQAEGQVRLRQPLVGADPVNSGYTLVDEVEYSDQRPWPEEWDAGESLQRVRADAFGNRGVNWVASAVRPAQFSELISLTGDVNRDQLINGADVDLLCAAILRMETELSYDLNQDQVVDRSDLTMLLDDILNARTGDANLDGRFDSSDLIYVFQSSEFEDATPDNSTWTEGDWNCDGEFTTGDLVAAFQSGGYNFGANAADSTPSAALPHEAGQVKSWRADVAATMLFWQDPAKRIRS
ncbi:MAG: lamin tail domain-containing protein [Pirellulaceae bacterium]